MSITSFPYPSIFRAKDVRVSRAKLRRDAVDGILDNPWRGIYVRIDAPRTGRKYAAFALRRPDVVFGGRVALDHHDLTDLLPHRVEGFIPSTTPLPRFDDIEHYLVQQDPDLLHVGVTRWEVLGVATWITSPARTVVDTFRFQGRKGLNIPKRAPVEALRDYVNARHPTGELIRIAKRFRLYSKMSPYIRAIQ
jgi:predicted transcriptional regulator of viral defense system